MHATPDPRPAHRSSCCGSEAAADGRPSATAAPGATCHTRVMVGSLAIWVHVLQVSVAQHSCFTARHMRRDGCNAARVPIHVGEASCGHNVLCLPGSERCCLPLVPENARRGCCSQGSSRACICRPSGLSTLPGARRGGAIRAQPAQLTVQSRLCGTAGRRWGPCCYPRGWLWTGCLQQRR